MSIKQFVIKRGDNIILGPISELNAYISTYAKCKRSPLELEIGESCLGEFSLSNSKATYTIERVS